MQFFYSNYNFSPRWRVHFVIISDVIFTGVQLRFQKMLTGSFSGAFAGVNSLFLVPEMKVNFLARRTQFFSDPGLRFIFCLFPFNCSRKKNFYENSFQLLMQRTYQNKNSAYAKR
jgi:hypothetical protein